MNNDFTEETHDQKSEVKKIHLVQGIESPHHRKKK